MYELSISDETVLDIADAIFYYNSIREGLGFEFQDHLSKEFAQLCKHPEIIQKRYRDVKISFFKKFPFGIHFLFNGNMIQVIAVLHTSRDPKRWIITQKNPKP